MATGPSGLRRILLVDDPSATTVSTSEGTRPALPGEAHGFDALAEALTRRAGVPAEVREDLGDVADPGTGVVIPASQLDRLLSEPGGRAAARRTAVVDVPREALLPMLELQQVAAAVEHNQYWKWKTGGRADAAIYGDLGVVRRLRREVTLTPLGDGRFGRIRIEGGDLPGLLADVLAATVD